MWSSESVVKTGQALKRGSCAVLVLPTADLGLLAEAGGCLLLILTGHQCFPMVCNALGFLLKHSTVFYNGGDDYLTLPRMLETGPVLPSSGEVW